MDSSSTKISFLSQAHIEAHENAFNHLANGIVDYLVTPFGNFSKAQ